MNICNLEPKKVFEFFSAISSIPHGSGNTEKIADYCIDFASKRGLKSYRDDGGNVMIFSKGTKGYEESEPVILQGHLDMVCEKDPDCKINMENEAITLCNDEKYIWADKTTLGGDDGIAIAYILAILDSDNIPHPPIEALLTNDEEIGMLGARELDASKLKAKRLINIDSEEEGILTVSCAGGVRAYCTLSLDFENTESKDLVAYDVEISGLTGGHSGIDINKNRKNAVKILSRLLEYVSSKCDFSISHLNGGGKENAIPQTAKVVLCVSDEQSQTFVKTVSDFYEILKTELVSTDPNVLITVNKTQLPEQSVTSDSTRKVIFALMQIPDGVQTMSPDIPNMVQTSLNLGTAVISDNALKMSFLIRSNAATGKQSVIQTLNSFVEYLDGKVIYKNDYPVWEYRADSHLRDIMVDVYKEVYADTPVIKAIHAGLECGILSAKIEDADMVSFGPNLFNVHTSKEKMDIESVKRCWNYLIKVLENLK